MTGAGQIAESAPAPTPRAGGDARQRLPGFIIGGAKKCATSTLHALLAARPDVFLPRDEVGFFHADGDRPLASYSRLFADAPPAVLCGERSTMYFASARGAERIAATLPAAKLIFVLRDPVARTYSHYWHRVRRLREGRAFAAVIADPGDPILIDSDYRSALGRYFDLFDRSQIHIVLFEELIAAPEKTLHDVSAFLGLRPFWSEDVDRHANPGAYPRWPRLVLGYNRLRRRIRVDRRPVLVFAEGSGGGPVRAAVQLVDAAVRRWAFSPHGRPPLGAETQARLAAYLGRVNSGLSNLIGRDLRTVWPACDC